jgi:hypothetical protein
VRWFATLTSPSAVGHAIVQVALSGGVFALATAAGLAPFRLSADCSAAVITALDLQTDVYVSREEFAAAVSKSGSVDLDVEAAVQDAELEAHPRCIRGDAVALLAVVLFATAYATFRWHAVGLSAAISLPMRWSRDRSASKQYWSTPRRLPSNDLPARVLQALRLAARECLVVATRSALAFVVFGGFLRQDLILAGDRLVRLAVPLPPAHAVMYGSAEQGLQGQQQQVDADGFGAWFGRLATVFVLAFVVGIVHSLHGTLLPIFLMDRIPVEELVSGVVGAPLQPEGAKGSPTSPDKLDLVLAALRVVRPRSLAHYVMDFPAHARAEAVAAAGGSAAQLAPSVQYVFPRWSPLADAQGGGAAAPRMQPSRLSLPNLPASTRRFKPQTAGLVRAWQERIECANWALFADPALAGQHGKGAGMGRGSGSPLRLLAAMLRASKDESSVSDRAWFAYAVSDREARGHALGAEAASRSVALATSSPWLHVIRDLILCHGSPPSTSLPLNRLGLLDEDGVAAPRLRISPHPLVGDFVLAAGPELGEGGDADGGNRGAEAEAEADAEAEAEAAAAADLAPGRTPGSATRRVGRRAGSDAGLGASSAYSRFGRSTLRTSALIGVDEAASAADAEPCAKSFIRSAGAQKTSSSERAAVYNDVQYRRWRDVLWAATGVIDSTTVALFAAASSGSRPAAAAEDRPVAVEAPVAAPARPNRLGPLADPVAAEEAAAARKPSTGDRVVAAGTRVCSAIWKFALLLWTVLVIRRLYPLGVRLAEATGVAWTWRGIVHFWTGVALQVRPYEPAAVAKIWARSGAAAATLHPLPLTLDEAVGAAAVDSRTVGNLSRVLIEVLAPRIDPAELDELATTTVDPHSFVGPASLAFPGAASFAASSGSGASGSRSRLGVSRLRTTLPVTDAGAVGRTFASVLTRMWDMAGLWVPLGIVIGLASDLIFALGIPHGIRVAQTFKRAVAVAAGYGVERSVQRALPEEAQDAAMAQGATARSEGGNILRKAFRASVTRSPDADTADLLRDARAVAAAAELLVSLISSALKGEDKHLRQVPPSIPVVVYSISSCLVACATYCSSPRYVANVSWTTPLFWRGTDEDSVAVAEVDAALANLSRLGGTMRQVPYMQVNVHLHSGNQVQKDEGVVEHAPRSARPALAMLQTGESLLRRRREERGRGRCGCDERERGSWRSRGALG